MTIKTVAVIGASGNVGAPTVKALLAAGFQVTAITREDSTSTFPDDVQVRKADLTSVDSLTTAFAGQDAVVTTIATSQVGNQDPITDAAVAAGVKRYIPSEFGHSTQPGYLTGPLAIILGGKTKAMEYVYQQAQAHPGFTWTGLATSLFFDFGLDVGVFGINVKDKTISIFDSGAEPASVSSLAFVADAVVAVLQHEEETANKYIDVVEFAVTQNQLVKILEEETGAKFAVSHTNTADLDRAAAEKLAKADYGGAFMDALQAWNFKEGVDHAVKETANGLLGLKGGDLRERVKEYLKSRNA